MTSCTSAAILASESSSCCTLVASRTQVMFRSASGRSRSSGFSALPGCTSSSASGRSADGNVFVKHASVCSSTAFFTRMSSRAFAPVRAISTTSPTWMPAICARLFQVSPVASEKYAWTR